MRRLLWLLPLFVVGVAAQGVGADAGGVLVRVDGETTVAADERVEVLVVVDGAALVRGNVTTLVVVDANATVDGGRVEDIVLVSGRLVVDGGGSVDQLRLVGGDVETPNGTVTDTVRGAGPGINPWAGALFGVLFYLGLAIAVVAAGLLLQLVAREPVAAVGRRLTQDTGATVGAAAVLWLAVPLATFLLFLTGIGAPLAFGVLVLLPWFWFIGYLVVALRIGAWLLPKARPAREAHPMQTALLGLVVAIAIGWLPVLGGLATLLAGLWGGGALLLATFRRARPRAHAAQS